jgi:hypothetical protein
MPLLSLSLVKSPVPWMLISDRLSCAIAPADTNKRKVPSVTVVLVITFRFKFIYPPSVNPFQVESLSRLPRSVSLKGNCRAKGDYLQVLEKQRDWRNLNGPKVAKLSIVPRSAALLIKQGRDIDYDAPVQRVEEKASALKIHHKAQRRGNLERSWCGTRCGLAVCVLGEL